MEIKCEICGKSLEPIMYPDEDGYVYMATSEFKPKRRYEDVEEAGAE